MTILTAAERLAAALDTVASALAAADTTALLAAEHGLSSAVANMQGFRTITSDERAAVARMLAQARASLVRCQVLGQSATDAAHATLLALGRRSADYGSTGAEMADHTAFGARGSAVQRRM